MALFLLKFYTSEGMILVDSLLLGIVSLICVAEISIFSHRFRTVLRTLGAINQVSTESQVKVSGTLEELVAPPLPPNPHNPPRNLPPTSASSGSQLPETSTSSSARLWKSPSQSP
jgi:hypothetical protein